MKNRNRWRAVPAAWRSWLGILPSVLALCLGGCGGSTEVEVVSPWREAIEESFSEPAKTRLAESWVIAMPVEGRIGRIALEPGDAVTTGQLLAEFDALPLEKSVAEAQARIDELQAQIRVKEDNSLEQTFLEATRAEVQASLEALNAAEAQIEAEEAYYERQEKELERMEALRRDQAIAQSRLDDVRLDAATALIDLREQEFVRAALKAIHVAIELGPGGVEQYIARKALERAVLDQQLAQARAQLSRSEHQLELARIVSPIAGVVLERHTRGDGFFAPGQPLLTAGDLRRLEIEADILTQDAMRLEIGSEVRLEPTSRAEPLPGCVKRIEPAGFTKVSSLGVEQQRVRVIVSLLAEPVGLGVGYRLQARFITGRREAALVVPRFSVLQSPDQGYYVLVVEDGKLQKQAVRLGLRSDRRMEVLDGLSPEDRIVRAPDSQLAPGMEVTVVENAQAAAD